MKTTRMDSAVAAVRARVARDGYAIIRDARSDSKLANRKLYILMALLIRAGYWIDSQNGVHIVRKRG